MQVTPIAAAIEVSLGQVVTNLPHDVGALIVYLLIGGMLFLVWYGNRKSTVDRYRNGRTTADSEQV